MAQNTLLEEPSKGGFSFENCSRNSRLAANGFKPPKAYSTGTTICGIVFKDGVVLGADTRATEGTVVADKNCAKIHYMAPNMYCCGAGTAADTEYTTNTISAQLELHSLNTGRIARVATACQLLKQYLFRYQGHIGAHLILGGVDTTGPHLYTIHQHGSTSRSPYTTMGSGCLAAMAVFETGYKPNMELEQAKTLVRDAVAAGVFNDLGSGSYIDLCVITKEGVDYIRPYDKANLKGQRQGDYKFKPGSTAIASETVRRFDVVNEQVQQMEVA